MTSEDYDRIVLGTNQGAHCTCYCESPCGTEQTTLADAYERALKKLSANDQPSNEKKGDCQNHSVSFAARFGGCRGPSRRPEPFLTRIADILEARRGRFLRRPDSLDGPRARAFMALRCYGHDSSECMEFAGRLYTDTYFRDFKEARLTMPELIYFDWQDLANWRVAFGTIPNFMGVPPVELIDSSRFFSMLNLIAACVKPIFSIGAALIEIVGWVNKSKAVGELAEATASVCAVLDVHAQDEDHRHMINGLRGWAWT